ncbi:MAG: hypothetical protein M3Q64_00295 [bacterium]|nr:hypothetical protein [bacterium]
MNESEIQLELQNILQRNQRIGLDKAWETSLARKLSIGLITYIIAVVVMCFLKVERYYLNALIPVIGYLLSTLSLPLVKKYWTKHYYEKI